MSHATATMDTWTVTVQGDAYSGSNPQGNDRYEKVITQYYDSNQHPEYALLPLPEGSFSTTILTGRNLCLFFTDEVYDGDNHGSITAIITSSGGAQTTWTIYAADAALVPPSTLPTNSPTGMWAVSAQGKAFTGPYPRDQYQTAVVHYNDAVTSHNDYALVSINGGSIGITDFGTGSVNVFLTDTDDSDNRGSVWVLVTALTVIP